MISISKHARTRFVSGRAVVVLLLAHLAGCSLAGPAPAGSGPSDPVLSAARPSPAGETEATRLFEAARAALAAGDLDRAREAAQEVVDRYPGARVSGQALRLLVDVAFAQESWREADLLAQRWIRLLPPGDARIPALRVLQGRARVRDGDAAGALDRMGDLPSEIPADVRADALEVVREVGTLLDEEALAARVAALPPGHAFRPSLLAAHARARYNGGAPEAGRESAEAALAAGALGTDADVARGVLEGRIDQALGLTGPVTIVGLLLPRTGPPSLIRFGDLVEEGIRAAASAARLPGRLEIVVADDHGTPEGAAAGMRALQDAGVVAVLGALDQEALAAAVGARTRDVPILSPTAPDPVEGARHVYTLGGSDPEAARALARWAARSGLPRAVLVYPREPEAEEEAQAFEVAFRNAGGSVVGRFPYERGSTYFETQMRGVEGLLPDAIVLPLPAEDVQLVAPQITFFGLDTLDIRILGTSAWTRDAVLRAVSPRHTNGVVAATAEMGDQEEGEGARALVGAYEALYRRTLRSPVPAVGYDAAALLLEALASGARSPEGVDAALQRIAGFPGATGSLAVADGRIARRQQVVCIQERRLLPIAAGERPVLIDRRPPPDSMGVRPSVAIDGVPVRVVCPGAPLP